MKVSIFTPTHKPTYLLESYNCLKNQNFDEWIICPNGGISYSDIPQEIRNDSRVTLVGGGINFKLDTDGFPYIGAIKKYCCSHATGDILLELDHDDLLLPPSMELVRNAFRDPEVVFAYSNAAEFNQDDMSPRMFGNATPETNIDTHNGWRYRDFWYDEVLYKEAISPSDIPYHVSLLLFAPNHFRAFRKTTYDAIGGHDENLSICDDADIMCRMYLAGKFYHIDECCYLYRVDGTNSWLQRNAAIQVKMGEIQKQYLMPMTEIWSKRNNFNLIDLGGRFGCPPGYKSVDLKDADIICDLNQKWAFEDSSVGVIRAADVIEHLDSLVHVMSEVHRVLVPGGYFFGLIPSTDGRGAWQDPTHKLFLNQNSFFYFTRRNQARYIDNTSIRFKKIILETFFPSQWEEENNIPYVNVVLMAMKNDFKSMGYEEI